MKSNLENNDKIIKFPSNNGNYRKTFSKNGIIRFFEYFVLISLLVIVIFIVNSDTSFNATNSVNTDTINLISANNYDFQTYKEGYVLAKDGKISCYNTNQELQWEVSGSKTQPTVKTNGKYCLVYYTQDNTAILTDGNKTKRINTDGNVQYGYVNKNGYFVLFVKETGLKNRLVVYNKNAEKLYYRDNPDRYIPNAVLSDNNYTLITSEIVTSSKNLSTKLVLTDIRKNKIISNIGFNNDVVGGCFFVKKNEFICVLDSKLISYSTSGKLKWQVELGERQLSKYSVDEGMIALLFNEDDSALTGSEVIFYNTKGKKLNSFKTDEKINNIFVFDNTALLTMNRQLMFINAKGKQLSSVDVAYDMKETLFLATKKCALVLSNSHEARLITAQ